MVLGNFWSEWDWREGGGPNLDAGNQPCVQSHELLLPNGLVLSSSGPPEPQLKILTYSSTASLHNLACAFPPAWLCGCGANSSVAFSILLPNSTFTLLNISYVLLRTGSLAAHKCPATLPTKLSCWPSVRPSTSHSLAGCTKSSSVTGNCCATAAPAHFSCSWLGLTGL